MVAILVSKQDNYVPFVCAHTTARSAHFHYTRHSNSSLAYHYLKRIHLLQNAPDSVKAKNKFILIPLKDRHVLKVFIGHSIHTECSKTPETPKYSERLNLHEKCSQ